MIDTIKIYTEIDKETYEKVKSFSIVKSSINNNTKQLLYEITNDHLEGSYSSSLSVRFDSGVKYGFLEKGYCIEIEGSYHKIKRGYNSHNGYYNLIDMSIRLIELVNNSYNIELPNIKHWFLQRVDIAIVFDLENQNNIKRYLENLHSCNYPRRCLKNYSDYGRYWFICSSVLQQH